MSTPAPAGPPLGAPGPAEPRPAEPEAPAPRRSLARHPDFRRLWVGDAFGQLGFQLTGIALPVLAVRDLGATEWQMGLLTAAETAAFLVIGLPTGAWVDRMRKRRVLITADLVRAATLAVVVALALTGHASMAVLYAGALVMSVATVFFDVAHQSYVPGLVGLAHVGEGNAKLQATQSVAGVAGPALGGALLRVVVAPVLLAVNVVTYLVSALALSRIRTVEELPAREHRRPLKDEIAEGLAFVVRQPLLRRIVACTAIGNLFGAVSTAVVVIFALRELGLDEAAYGTVLSASAVGGLLGAVASDRLVRWFGEGRVIPLSALAFAPGAALTPLAAVLPFPPQATLVAGGVLFYGAVVVYNVAQVSFRQRVCPPPLLGRMNASVRFIVWGTTPIGGLLGGWLGHTLGALPTLWIAAGGAVVASLPVLLSPLLRMRELPGAPEPR
ncbi:MFS transporter [Cellulomonas pakistanensis]|uniref:MFS transporter n=1 Tax=Cellulomonas pakistanensis TaxID=992287 RepID=A0A919PA93_9CELL|nr:MFS transporter [Cellulomonas pakistanensis]GIG35254.1 MFS transporter [Cellulomonas pakistanensis]